MIDETLVQLQNKIHDKYRHYNRWAILWSAVYHSSLYISAVLSAGAALILQLGVPNQLPDKTDLSAILAGFAAALAAIAAAGGFDRKWRVSRNSRNDIEQLEMDFLGSEIDTTITLEKLKEIVQKHNEGISGAS
ncbi:hypothetical protein ACFLWS_06510 [Chloroflexota bacterium]